MAGKRKIQKKRRFRIPILPLLSFALVGLISILFYAMSLDVEVRAKFEGTRWEVPSRVFARPLDLYAGEALSIQDLLLELKQLRYKNSLIDVPGNYFRRDASVYIYMRPFKFPDESVNATRLRVDFEEGKIKNVINRDTLQVVDLWRLEPVFIGGIYPKRSEDRVLVKLDEVPKTLTDTLIAVEDRDFYHHFGIAPLSILRALIANIQAGRRVQGGSTLTQQLVKNFYLTDEKTISRKLNEAIMALLLELHYSKNEILQAYLNEVYLGQDGRRAIHGFGLAAQFYFDKSIQNLDARQCALLVGLVKGASYYDPRRFPKRALVRRQVVQKIQLEQGIITDRQYKAQVNEALGVSKNKPSGISPYPYFLDLVKRQLKRDYSSKDLKTAGLRLFTSLDPIVQSKAEKAIKARLKSLEKRQNLPPDTLQVAAMITNPGTGEVRALIGGRNFRRAGFNRALDASRQIGSLIKPIVYLTALQQSEKYYLNTLIPDEPVEIPLENGENWTPENYDKQYHGKVSLTAALADSYNVATVNLGMNVGLERVIANAHRLGIKSDIKAYPAILLGATQFSLYEITQAYQTIASEGFKTPIRSIKTVTTGSGESLVRYPLTVEQVIKPEYAYLVLNAMKAVMTHGTGKSVYWHIPKDFTIAGKTGTTNDYRDSWFAGLTGDNLTVIWVGADDNRPIMLSGSSGALNIWSDIFKQTGGKPLNLIPPESISFVKANYLYWEKDKKDCITNQVMPVVTRSLPSEAERLVCTNE